MRAKKTLSNAQVPFELPRGTELQVRLAAVLEVIYLIFNEGYAATAGDDWMRPALCEEALRLARMLRDWRRGEREALGLVALLELQASRLNARTDAAGRPILLLDQDRSRWDWLLINRGLAALKRARDAARPARSLRTAGRHRGLPRRRSHPRSHRLERHRTHLRPNWRVCSPHRWCCWNRAVAVGMADGAGAALPLVEALDAEGALAQYHLLPAVRGDLLAKLGRHAEARAAFERAAGLAQNQRERALMLERARATPD